MADNSFAWAEKRGLVRKNAVHGAEEAKLVIEEKFKFSEQTGAEMSAEGSFTVEGQGDCMFDQVEDPDMEAFEEEHDTAGPISGASFKFLVDMKGHLLEPHPLLESCSLLSRPGFHFQ